MPYPLNNMFQSTLNGLKHISGHENHPKLPGSWVTPWSGPRSCCWHCFWCWCPSDSSETCSNQLRMVKNIYLDTKINLLWCQGAELHIEVALDHVVGIVVVVGVHLTVLKPVPINSAWSKTYIWTPRSTFYDSRELSYTLKWPWTLLLALLLVLVYIWQLWNLFQSTQHAQKHISGHQDQPSIMPGSWVTPWSGPRPCHWQCCWCWCTSGSSETCSSQLSMVKKF